METLAVDNNNAEAKESPRRHPLHWESTIWWASAFWLVMFTALYSLSWQVSTRLESVPDFVSWFLPGGVRFISLVLLTPKRWVIVWLGEQIAIAGFTQLAYDYPTILQTATDSLLPWACAALPIYLLLHWRRPIVEYLITLAFITRVATAAVIASALNATVLTTSFVLNGLIPPDRIAELWPAFILGDFMGITLIGCFAALILAMTSPTNANVIRWYHWLIPFVGIGAELSVPSLFPPQEYFIKLLSLLPVIVGALRYGLYGAALTLVTINSMIVIAHLMGVPWDNMQSDQFFLLASCFGGIALGAATDEQRYVYAKLAKQNARLLDLVEQLNAINADYERLANRLMNAEERERGRISRELHDGLGQVLSAARIRLAAAQTMDPGSEERGDTIGEVADIIEGAYGTAREIMEQLAPAALRHGGFETALGGPEIALFLKNASVDYVVDVNCQLDDLKESAALNLLRIVQECANNTVKHAQASRFTVRLDSGEGALILTLSDDGKGFDPDTVQEGMGLRNIRDRVAALGGSYELQVIPDHGPTRRHGTTHLCTFPLTKLVVDGAGNSKEVPFLKLA